MAVAHRILIVDDEPQITSFLAFTFEDAGYVVMTACNGRDAIALCSAESFDVGLSDVTMPEIDGHQLVQWLAAHYPKIRTALMSVCDVFRDKRQTRCQPIQKPIALHRVV